MENILKCESCGGTNQLPKGKTTMFCAFCGNVIEKIIIDIDKNIKNVSRIKTKPKISKKRKELKITGKEIKSLTEIIDWFTDSELESIKYLDLSNNKITELQGLKKFKNVDIINLDNNNIKKLNYLGKFNHLQILSLNNNNNISAVNGLFVNKFDVPSSDFETFKGKNIYSNLIYLEKNNITSFSEEAVINLKELLIVNQNPLEIRLSGNPIDKTKNNKIFNKLNTIVSAEEVSRCGDFWFQESLVYHLSNYYKEKNSDWPNKGAIKIHKDSFNESFNKFEKEYQSEPNFLNYLDIFYDDYGNYYNKVGGDIRLTLLYPDGRNVKKALNLCTGYSVDDIMTPSSKCFIATAVMGSYDHPQVMELRRFRDEWILTKDWGSGFVNWYYHYGEKVAKVIDKSFALKKLSYLLIVRPLVYLSRIIKK